MVHISKQSLFRLKITVGCPPFTCPSIRVCVCGVCVCVLVCAVVYVLRVCVWDVRFVWLCCGVLCCVVMCGVGAGVGVQCVVCGLWCVCVVCVVCAAWHTELPLRVQVQNVSVCRFKTPPCVPAKRPHEFNISGRFASTHGGVLNLHMDTF